MTGENIMNRMQKSFLLRGVWMLTLVIGSASLIPIGGCGLFDVTCLNPTSTACDVGGCCPADKVCTDAEGICCDPGETCCNATCAQGCQPIAECVS